jgi:hypothetical protein
MSHNNYPYPELYYPCGVEPAADTDTGAGTDFTKFVSLLPYVPNQLILFLKKTPDSMEPVCRDALKALIEQRVSRLNGMFSGSIIYEEVSSKKYARMPAVCRPIVEFQELYGKPIHQLLEDINRKYVIGRSSKELADGVEILVVERDPTGTLVQSAWLLKDVIFSNTGICPQRRDLFEFGGDGVIYRIPLICDVQVSDEVTANAQAELDKLNSKPTPEEADKS